MAVIRVVENPRRRSVKRRRTLSAKQRAAGFGGKRSMSGRGRSRAKRRTKRRRNPLMASLVNPRPRRASNRRRSRYTVTGVARRQRKNPRIGPFNIDIMSAVCIGGGILSTEIVPRMVKKLWSGLPTVGLPGYGVKVGVALGMGYLVGRFTNSRNGGLVTAGGLSIIFVDLFRQYALPKIPFLSGLADDSAVVTATDLENLYGYVDASGVEGYVDRPASGFGGFVDNPQGGF